MNNYKVPPGEAGAGPATLSISEVSRRTGIPAAGLRNWEQRYGLPRPQRTPSGQRRYTEADCSLLADVLRLRESGLSLPAAMALAAADADRHADISIFAGLRRRHPGLQVHTMPKAIMLAVTWAIEDECCARAQRPLLLGSFQHQRFYRAAQLRWADLARSAEQMVVFADFAHSRCRPGGVVEVAVPESSPVRREWALVCEAPDFPACLTGWELPGQDELNDRDRAFEMLWSVDPQVVRDAARIGIGLAAPACPEVLGPFEGRLAEEASPASADLLRASGLLERILDYLSRPSPGRER